MKKSILLFVLLLGLGTLSFGQTFIWESFDGNQMPPTGWSIDGLSAQWSVANSNNAGGTAPEAKFSYVQQNTTTRFISPMCNLTGLTTIKLSFKHMYDWYDNPAPKVGVATRSHNGAWTSVWEKSPTGNVGPEQIDLVISNSDIGQSEFQFCFYLTGDMYALDYWYLDNVLLFNPLNLDASMISIGATASYFSEPFQVQGSIMNVGLTTITDAEINYQLDNGPVFSTDFTGLSLPTQSIYDFTCDQLLTGAIGDHELTVWINKINGTPDDNHNNDTLRKTVYKICYIVPRKPLFEEFTSSTCSPCASFNTDFVPWCNTNEDSITLIKYQMNWPSPGDPYYTEEGGVRRDFYGVGFVPDLYVNGGNCATDMTAVVQSFNQAKQQIGMMEIAGSHSLNGTVMTINATVLPFSDFTNVRVYIVVMEKITHNNHKTNGETSFEHVMMKMVPDAEGTTTNLADRVPFTINETVDLAGTHIEEFTDLIVGIFVQDPVSRAVLQSVYSEENAQFNDEARLNNIFVAGQPLVGFDPDTFNYVVNLPGGATQVPEVTGTPIDNNETVIVVPSLELLGTTTIDVFAENLVDHNLYSLNFQWAEGHAEAQNDNIKMYPNPTSGTIYIYGASNASVSIYNSVGSVVAGMEHFTGNSLNLSALPKGIYLMKIEKTDHSIIQKKIVIM
ncbi:MAG: T9SS type A sorting domain-containing protein [Bacteroidales bacterium]|nr:T9SS type A sorting domain-containing protein [Bacteroidales bacterium]